MRSAVAKTVAACYGVVVSPASCLQLPALPSSLTVRGFAEAALDCLHSCLQAGEQRSSRADSSSSTNTASKKGRSIQGSNLPAKCGSSQIQDHSFVSGLQQWRSVAQLTAADAEELLLQHPYLQSYLSSSQGFQPSTYYVNMAFLSLHPAELASQQHTALRAVLAVLPPVLLQSLAQVQPLRQVLQQQQPGHVLAHTLQAALWQLGREQHDPMMSRQQEMQQIVQSSSLSPASSHNFHHVAEAVVTALGLPVDNIPADEKLLARMNRVVQSASRISSNASASASSASSSSGNNNNSSNSSTGSIGSKNTGKLSSLSLSARFISTDVQAPTSVNVLARALEVTSRSSRWRNKPLHDAVTATQLAQGLRQSGGLNQLEVLHLLLQRPVVLWQHATPNLPGQLLSDLVQLLPDLGQPGRVSQLVLNTPRVLSCSSADLHAVVDLLTTHLQLNATEASELVQRCPQLLWRPTKLMLSNMGFLTGLGATLSDLRQMACKDPRWLISSLRDLTVRWHCLQEVVKVSLQDVLLLPQLLTLSVTKCLGPRVMFASTRKIKLLTPSEAYVMATDASTEAARLRPGGKVVPLEVWLLSTEQRMCRLMDLDLDDFKKYKDAWQEKHASYWERCSLKAMPGSQQLRLSQWRQHN